MPRSNHRRPTTPRYHLPAGKHSCLWPRCPEQVRDGQLMDQACWDRLPYRLKQAWREARRAGDPDGVAGAVARITEWARRQDVAEQEASMS